MFQDTPKLCCVAALNLSIVSAIYKYNEKHEIICNIIEMPIGNTENKNK